MNNKIVCVVPSIRESMMAAFRKAWAPLFEKHGVTLITVWDGDDSTAVWQIGSKTTQIRWDFSDHKDLLFRKTDAIRNMGFIEAAKLDADYILTLDDDVHPPAGSDPIQEHLDVLQRRVPISWMNTAQEEYVSWKMVDGEPGYPDRHRATFDQGPIYLRGFPYGIRDESPVKVSHGVWVNVPDFDGRTQLELGKCQECGGTGGVDSGGTRPDGEPIDLPCPNKNCKNGYDGSRLPYSLPYFRGPVPKGCYFPFCGMNVMVRKEALPYLYFAPMGPDTNIGGTCKKCFGNGFVNVPSERHDGQAVLGKTMPCECEGKPIPTLNRFADIWCGNWLKKALDGAGWAMYTGASTVIHTRASDPFKNVEQERLGIEWNERMRREMESHPCIPTEDDPPEYREYMNSYADKRRRFHDLIKRLQGAS